MASCSKKTVESEIGSMQVIEEETAAIEEQPLTDASAEMAFQEAKNRFESEDIYFANKSYALQPEVREILERKAQWLKQNPTVNVVIEGHTDEAGTPEYNLALGDRRAGNVKSFLIRQGIESSRLAVVSFGKEQPVESGESEESRAKNRRVHFAVE
jgi:peptidoglycan-associated lipoprotein